MLKFIKKVFFNSNFHRTRIQAIECQAYIEMKLTSRIVQKNWKEDLYYTEAKKYNWDGVSLAILIRFDQNKDRSNSCGGKKIFLEKMLAKRKQSQYKEVCL